MIMMSTMSLMPLDTKDWQGKGKIKGENCKEKGRMMAKRKGAVKR
jgi:hypothetical protein